MLNEEIFMKYITALAEMYAPKPLSDVVMEMYYLVLKDMNEKDFISSVEKLMSEWNYSYMPKPAHILNALKSKENFEVEANNEWKLVVEAVERQGRYKNVVFENLATNSAVHTITGGDWSELCSKTYEQLDWIKKEFVKFYIHFRNSHQKLTDKMLTGLNDEIKAVEIKSSVNDTKILKSNKNAIESKIDSKKQQLNNLISNSVKKF
jgi:hypothetical protein